MFRPPEPRQRFVGGRVPVARPGWTGQVVTVQSILVSLWRCSAPSWEE